MMYYLEKIRLIFVDEEPTIGHVTKLMTRCLKLYESINQFIQAFKLIQKKELYDELVVEKPEMANEKQNILLMKRLKA